MTNIGFFLSGSQIKGFKVSGHATENAEDEVGRLVCSAVSSAAYLTANTITDVIGAKADIKVSEGEMTLMLLDSADDCQVTLKGFRLHVKELSKQFKNYVIVNSEV